MAPAQLGGFLNRPIKSVAFAQTQAQRGIDRRLRLGRGGGTNIDGDLAFANSEHLSCELLPIAIEQHNALSGTGSEHAAQVLSDGALKDHLITGRQRLVCEESGVTHTYTSGQGLSVR